MTRREEQTVEGNGTLRKGGTILGDVKYVLTRIKVYVSWEDGSKREPDEYFEHEEIAGTMEETGDPIDIAFDESLTLVAQDGREWTIYILSSTPSNRSYTFSAE